jgi:hypothetical protein
MPTFSTATSARLSNYGESLKSQLLRAGSQECIAWWMEQKGLCDRTDSTGYRNNVGDAEIKWVSADPSS